jgi:hypothetical protein
MIRFRPLDGALEAYFDAFEAGDWWGLNDGVLGVTWCHSAQLLQVGNCAN